VRALRRDGARAGDELWVSGDLGGAAWAVAHRQASGGWARPQGLTSAIFEAAQERLHRPLPRVTLGKALAGLASAAIDLSDGLSGDLGHVLARSSQACGHRLAARIALDQLPLHPVLGGLPLEQQWRLALAGGDDYELLFSAPVSRRSELQALATRLALPLTRIGQIEPVRQGAHDHEADRLRLIDAHGRAVSMTLQAHDHFSDHASRYE
jgi:thiamine-monophosphate kinase